MSIKLKGELQDIEITVLIDSRGSQFFMHPICGRIPDPVDNSVPFHVTLGNS